MMIMLVLIQNAIKLITGYYRQKNRKLGSVDQSINSTGQC